MALFVMTACSHNSQNINKIYGTIDNVGRDSLVLVAGHDTLYLAHTHNPECTHSNYIAGDSVMIVYHDQDIDDIAVIAHSQPGIDNASVLLIGTWDAENYRITLSSDNSATIEDDGDLCECQWMLSKNNVLMCFGSEAAETRSYNLLRVDNDSLIVIIGDGSVLRLARTR